VKVIDVCAGAGGFSLGLQRAGWEVHGVELDPDAVATHRRYVGPCDIADITTWHPLCRADLVVGGVPCQSFSVAGNRGGIEDPRGQLFTHLVRIALEAHARAVVLENVRGLLSTPGAFEAISGAMRAAGFSHVEHRVMCAADYGTPQMRFRVFVVGLRPGVSWAWPAPTHVGRHVTVRQALGLGAGPYRTGRIDGATGWSGQRLIDVDAPSTTTTTTTAPDLLALIDAPAKTIMGSGMDQTPSARPSQRPMYALGQAVAAAGLADRPATTICGDFRMMPAGKHSHTRRSGGAVRLTVDQCAILQGFPSGWAWSGNRKAQHRQVGNAVPPQLGEAIGRAAWDVLRPRGIGARLRAVLRANLARKRERPGIAEAPAPRITAPGTPTASRVCRGSVRGWPGISRR
jgi:DNA (cytosine-5)-methyltransferase 1